MSLSPSDNFLNVPNEPIGYNSSTRVPAGPKMAKNKSACYVAVATEYNTHFDVSPSRHRTNTAKRSAVSGIKNSISHASGGTVVVSAIDSSNLKVCWRPVDDILPDPVSGVCRKSTRICGRILLPFSG